MARAIRSDDLALYAINTSYFYPSHVLYARKGLPLSAWMDHIRERVIPLYCKEIESVTASYDATKDAAFWMQDYYQRHIQEMEVLS